MNRHQGSRHGSGRLIEVIILIGLPILCHFLFPIKIVVTRPYTYLGIVVMLLGLGLNIEAARHFRQVGTGFQLQGGGAALVTSGPFHFSRNPMYLGMLIWLLGLAVLLGSLISFVFPLLFYLLVNTFVIPLEERHMEQLFGDEYHQFTQRTRRWL
jgi:protein-S-isoprenylcysteine O-methyltransferase Ste14